MHSPALADLLGRLPAPPPDQRSNPQPPTSCRGLWAVCHPWRQGGRHGWRSLIRRCSRAVDLKPQSGQRSSSTNTEIALSSY